MRPDKTIVLINSVPWLLDFRRNRFTQLPKSIHRVLGRLENLFDFFDYSLAFDVWRRAIRYRNYANAEAVLEEDAESNKYKHSHGMQPALELSEMFGDAAEKTLAGSSDPILSACDIVLNHSMASLGTHSFHADTIQLRPSPSVGARHGIDVLVHIGTDTYYYSGSRHSLLHIGEKNNLGVDLAMTFFCRADVYMWRYPQGSCLLDVYLDFGHILGNISISAKTTELDTPVLITRKEDEKNLPIGAVTLGTIQFRLRQGM